MNQLEKDLLKRTEEKHNKWIMDTCSLYEMAGLDPPDAGAAMTIVLLKALAVVRAAGHKEPDVDELVRVLKHMIKVRVKELRNIRKREI